MRLPSVRLQVLFVLASTLAWAQPSFGQDDVDLNQFEEIAPDVQEVTTQQTQRPVFRETVPAVKEEGGPRFEEYRPQIEELDIPAGGSAPAPSPAPGLTPAAVASPPAPAAAPSPYAPPPAPAPVPLPRAFAEPPPPAPVNTAPVPIVAPPVLEPAPVDGGAVRVKTRTGLPSQGLTLDGDFEDQLRSLNSQIALLREKVIEAKSRLLSYSQKVAQGFASGTQLYMKIDNELGSDFQIEKLVFFLDGHQIFSREFAPDEEVGTLLVYRGSVLPGRHRIDVEAVLNADNGLFDFGFSKRLALESGQYFAANEGKIVDLDLVMFDQGKVFTAAENRPALRFEIVERDVY